MSPAGLDLLKRSEGCVLTCYADPIGVPTIGYGHILNMTPADIGRTRITEAEAEDLLRESDLPRYEAAVERMVRVPMTQGHFDALVDFAFNLGIGALANSTLLRLFNAGDTDGASKQFGRWVHAGAGILPGLVTRREAERKLFLS